MFVNMYVCLETNVGESGHQNHHHHKNHQPGTENDSTHLTSRQTSNNKLGAIDSNHPQPGSISSTLGEILPNTNNSFLTSLLSYQSTTHKDSKTETNKEPEIEPQATDNSSRIALKTVLDTTAASITTTPRSVEDDMDTGRFYFNAALSPEETSTLPSANLHNDQDLTPSATALTSDKIPFEALTQAPKPQDEQEQNEIDRYGNIFPSVGLVTTTELPPKRSDMDLGPTIDSQSIRRYTKQEENRVIDDPNIDNNMSLLQGLKSQLQRQPSSIELLQALRRLNFYQNLSKFARQFQPNMFESGVNSPNSRPETLHLLPVGSQDPTNDLAASDSSPSDSSTIDQDTPKKPSTEKTPINKDSTGGLRQQKPPKISLISPYSANFDHGFPPLRNHQTSRASQSQLLSETFVGNTLKLKNGKIDKPKKQTDGADDVFIKKHRFPSTKPGALFATLESGGTKSVKSISTKRPSTSRTQLGHHGDHPFNDLNGADQNANRGDRHTNESTIKKIIDDSRVSIRPPDESTTSLPLNEEDSRDNDFSEPMNTMNNPFNQPLSKVLSELATKYDGYPNDPYKKSLYYTDGHMQDPMNLPYKPLTIKDLARHHGVPFRLRPPFEDRLNLASPSTIDLKTALDTRLEDYNIDKLEQDAQYDGLKVDDDVRQKSAMKAIEAIAQEPDFLMRLHESIYGQGNQLHPESISHLQRLYSYLLRPDINYPSKVTTAASSNAVNRFVPGPINPLDFATSYASTSEVATRPISTSTRKPVNLVVTDLADKWALTRMPDLIPIPLAATVPGYLIRLPDGKILAAALTNSFTIQGIQNEPLNSGYKNFLNTKLKSIIKSSPTKHNVNHVASDSTVKQVIVPLNQPVKVQHPYRNKNPTNDMGLLRGVFSHLGLGKNSAQKNNSVRDNGGSKTSQNKIVKISNSPFPVPMFSDQELASLPVADLNDPVFSFTDESQLIDNYYETPPMRPPQYPYHQYPVSTFRPSTSGVGDATDMVTGSSTSSIHHKAIDQLANIRSLLHGNIFMNGERRGSVGTKKLESPLLWLLYKAAKRLSHSSACNSSTGVRESAHR